MSVSNMSATGGSTQTSANSRLWKRIKQSVGWYPFIIINILQFLIMSVIPWFLMIWLSFYHWDLLSPRRFAGLDNYLRLVKDELLHLSLFNTFKYLLYYVPALLVISLVVSILVNRQLFGMKFFRATYFLPNVTSIAVLSLVIWRFVLPNPQSPANYLLGLVGIPPQDWLVSPTMALPTLAGVEIWQAFGYFMVIWLAGLQAVPNELLDAATVDGASGWRLHWYVTIPLLRPTATFVIIISTLGALKVFTSIFILTGGGPYYSTTTIAYHVYDQAFNFGRVGYSSTISMVFMGIVLFITYLQGKYLKFGESYY